MIDFMFGHFAAITWSEVQQFALGLGVFALLIMVARKLESLRPIERHDTPEARREIANEYKHAVAHRMVIWFLSPLTSACAVSIVNTAGGGGIIDLDKPEHWYSWLATFVFFILVLDCYRYWLHRLSHAVPFLWKLHSFHHSAERITIITGARHLWLDAAIGTAFFPLITILFRASPHTALIVQMVYILPDGLAHLNYRMSLGRYVGLLNNSQWHRIHHSVEPKHFNKNFASLFPFMDMIFGTAYFPARDEFPDTGLVPGERPDVVEGLLWPFRRLVWSKSDVLAQ